LVEKYALFNGDANILQYSQKRSRINKSLEQKRSLQQSLQAYPQFVVVVYPYGLISNECNFFIFYEAAIPVIEYFK
jgi:hypothetical protein